MPRATLKFQLPEEQDEFDNAINGALWRSVVQQLDNWLRSYVKHRPESEWPNAESVRIQLEALMTDRCL